MSKIMSWSKCSVEIGKTGALDAMAETLSSIGDIKDKSTTLATEDGEQLKMKASGGKLHAQEDLEGNITLTTRIIEPDYAFVATLIGATHTEATKKLVIKSQVVSDTYSVKVTPKNIGATGLEIRKAHVKYKDGYSEEEGHYADLTFTILETSDGELYTKFTKQA